jgi:hypothetical protein
MRQINNWEQIEEQKEFEALKPGGYIAVIKNVQDDADKEYLKVSYDIAEGQYKDYYMNLYKSKNFWGGSFFRSYKEKAQPMFKGFINAIEKSNPGYKWNWDEKTLKGKKIGIVLMEEEYVASQGASAGQVKTRLIVQEVRTLENIRKGEFKVKDKKTVAQSSAQQTSNNSSTNPFEKDFFKLSEDDIQF